MNQEGMEVIYTWEMDFNSSMLSAATMLVPRRATEAPAAQLTMPTWAHASWVCFFTSMLAIAIGGNAIVIWIVTAHRRMRTVTNYFLVNLSFADLMMASLNCLFNFIYMLHSDWVFGVKYCKLSNFIANVTVAASVFTLTGISFDRFQAIVRPMRPRMSKTSSLVMIGCIWFSGMILAVPCLLYSDIVTYTYQVLFFIVTYAVPMLGMICFYTAMGRVLWGSRSIGELTQRQIDSMKSKRKVVRMFILVIAIFGICWLPYQSYFIYTHFDPSIMYKKYIQHVYLGFYWLAMANAMVNPIIYYWMNAKFRSYFRTAMCGWRSCLRRSKARHAAADSPPADRHSHSGSRSRSGIAEEQSKNLNNRSTLTYEIRFTLPPSAAAIPLPRSCPPDVPVYASVLRDNRRRPSPASGPPPPTYEAHLHSNCCLHSSCYNDLTPHLTTNV